MPGAAVPPPRDLTREVAAILRGQLARNRYAAKDLIAPLGISLSQINKLLKGEKAISLDVLDLTCEFLGLDPRAVIEEASDAITRHRATGATVTPLVRRAPATRTVARVEDVEDRAVAFDPGYLPDEDPDVLD